MKHFNLAFQLTPHGTLRLVEDEQALTTPLDEKTAQALLHLFSRSAGLGLLHLGAAHVQTALPPDFAYWRDFGVLYVTTLCGLPNIDEQQSKTPQVPAPPPVHPPAPPSTDLHPWLESAPVMSGSEYLTVDILLALWQEIDAALAAELKEARCSVQDFLQNHHAGWNLVGRVHFNLAENREDENAPFAFLATYTTRLTAHGKAQHVPLGQALREYAGAAQKNRLLSLLSPIKRAAQNCAWLKSMIDQGEIFHPLRFNPDEAYVLLRDVPQLESAGIVVRLPASWIAKRPPRPQVTATIGGSPPSMLGLEALLDFKLQVTFDGENLSPAEIEQLLTRTDGLALLRGRWIEVNSQSLRKLYEQFRQLEINASSAGLTFAEAMRLMSGITDYESTDATSTKRDSDYWSRVVAGPWLAEQLEGLRSPEKLALVDPGPALRGTLRPYQQVGMRWLYLLSQLGLGACLADDMGLGKTIQVLSLLLILKAQRAKKKTPSLLIVPASLIANWSAEIKRFAPSLKTFIAHKSALPNNQSSHAHRPNFATVDLVITSYGSLSRFPGLSDRSWNLIIIDEAQAIKNPKAQQTRAVKSLTGRARFALTGTPIENRLADLWSIFDFINPGLLGSSAQFSRLVNRLAQRRHNTYGPLRELVRPYILRRLKTDKSVIADLPDKTELKAYCSLSRVQTVLYQQAVGELARHFAQGVEGIDRKGLILSTLMRLKQICNHPSQWLGDGAYTEKDSGKYARLRDLCEVIAAKQEKALIFTQFRELTEPLSIFLGGLFKRPGLVMHGETNIQKRQDLVRQFQEDEDIPFFVLSLKVGGAGLNLTAASHVIHFDRWWNPAVENQATDRAFRIGQTKNVLVHKFVCRGTVEEKIDALIEAKKQLSDDVLTQGAQVLLTEMNNEELLNLVSLDIRAAWAEG